jgi:thioredoxin-like negative regulator of GroEL
MRQSAAAFTGLVLLCYPCPSWSQDSTATLIAICDQAAAPPLDQSRPTGVAGVALEKIDPKIAIPACDAAAKAAPNDPRVAFLLGRAYLAAKDYESARAHLKFAADGRRRRAKQFR